MMKNLIEKKQRLWKNISRDDDEAGRGATGTELMNWSNEKYCIFKKPIEI
jgi:hypothetical protein